MRGPAVLPARRPHRQTAPPLDHLPYHLLKLIASYAEELSVWRLAAASRALREAAKVPLQPHLARKSVTSKPPYITDIFQPMDIVSERDTVRHASLENAIERFQTHLAIFPPSRYHLRDLTVEVRMDDYHTGWQQIKRFANRLERLSLHFLDPVGLAPDEGDDDEYDGDETLVSLWPDLIDKPLSALTSLTIACNVRILTHFGGIAPFVPHLRDVTLSSYGPDEYEYTVFDSPDFSLKFDLVTLTLAGYPSTIIHCLDRILPLARNLASLTIRVPPVSSMPLSIKDELLRVLRAVSKRRSLRNLGLYGGAGELFMGIIASLQALETGRYDFPHITMAVFERLDGKEGQGTHPLLSDQVSAHFSSLHSITYFDRHTDANGHFTLGSYDKTGFHDFFRSKQLFKLFTTHPHLCEVRWIAGYPTSPFEPTSTLPDGPDIRCRAQRLGENQDDRPRTRDRPSFTSTKDGLKLRVQRASWTRGD